MKISCNSVNLEVVCGPILSREADDEFRPEAAGAAARRGAVAEAGAAPDADATIPGPAVTAPHRAARGPRNAVSQWQALSVPPAPAEPRSARRGLGERLASGGPG